MPTIPCHRPDLAHASRTPRVVAGLGCAVLAVSAVLVAPAWAEQADRNQAMTLESDQPCTVNLAKRTSVCSGNVVITQGTLQLRADRLELNESATGFQTAQATGSTSQPARFRQKRDGVDETIEGQARRIDYDAGTGVLRFDGQAVVRRLRGSVVADEVQGASIVWDSRAEQLKVQGGASTATNPSGRVRAVITPRAVDPPAAAGAASTPAEPLRSSPTLGGRP